VRRASGHNRENTSASGYQLPASRSCILADPGSRTRDPGRAQLEAESLEVGSYVTIQCFR